MNLYQMLRVPLPTAQSVAQATFGGRTIDRPTAIRNDVQNLFNRAAGVRGRIDAKNEAAYYLGPAGVGLNGLGAVSGRPIFPGGPGLVGTDSPDVWFGTNQNWRQAGWMPLPQATLNHAGDVWAALQQSSAPADSNFFTQMQARLTSQLADVDRAIGDHSTFGYTQTAIDQGLNALNLLKGTVLAIAAWVPSPAASVSPMPPAAGTYTSTAANTYASQAAQQQQQAIQPGFQPPSFQPQGSAPFAPPSSGLPIVPIVLGVGVLAVGAFFLLRK